MLNPLDLMAPLGGPRPHEIFPSLGLADLMKPRHTIASPPAAESESLRLTVQRNQCEKSRKPPPRPAAVPVASVPRPVPRFSLAICEVESSIRLRDMPDIAIRPDLLGFVPPKRWMRFHAIAFSSLVRDYFRARSSRKIRFEHKLWNALAISRQLPELTGKVGVLWQSNTIFKVDKNIFGELLAVTRPGSAFFSQRGSFNSHGFHEISVREATAEAPFADFSDVDEVTIRLYKHTAGRFRSNSTYQDVDECSWARVTTQM
jgi:hypothetical protein